MSSESALPTPTAPIKSPGVPKELENFKKYVESKWCYYSPVLEQAQIQAVHEKVAYLIDIKVLFEERSLRTIEQPYPWSGQGKTFLGSHTLGK